MPTFIFGRRKTVSDAQVAYGNERGLKKEAVEGEGGKIAATPDFQDRAVLQSTERGGFFARQS